MEDKNVKISVDNLEELLTGSESEKYIEIMRLALIQIRDSEGHDNDPEKNKKLRNGLLNGEKFNKFKPDTCFGKISYSHLASVLKDFGYPVSQKGSAI